jgi:hypothetical protein
MESLLDDKVSVPSTSTIASSGKLPQATPSQIGSTPRLLVRRLSPSPPSQVTCVDCSELRWASLKLAILVFKCAPGAAAGASFPVTRDHVKTMTRPSPCVPAGTWLVSPSTPAKDLADFPKENC